MAWASSLKLIGLDVAVLCGELWQPQGPKGVLHLTVVVVNNPVIVFTVL